MHSEHINDQAEGLRRLLLRSSARVVTVAAARGGLGATSVVVNLAASLARSGKEVLVLDENIAHDNVASMLALKPRYDLLNVVRGDKSWREIMLFPQPGVCVLPAARAIQALPQLSAAERERLLQCMAEASRNIDIVLVDAATSMAPVTTPENSRGPAYVRLNAQPPVRGNVSAGSNSSGIRISSSPISANLAPDQPLLLVLNATASAITESYALIKRMAMLDGRKSFGVIVNKVRDEQAAQAVFGNMAEVARRHLQVCVEYLGYIPLDDKLQRATQLCRPVVEVFPAAQSALAFGELGRKLALLPVSGNKETGGLSDVVQRLIRQARLPNMAHVN
jgi:flagellar biosynthesis protein FlhG